jgi:hypothetical protein
MIALIRSGATILFSYSGCEIVIIVVAMGFKSNNGEVKFFRTRWAATVASLLVFATLSLLPAGAAPRNEDPLRSGASNRLAREVAGTFVEAAGKFQASPISARKTRWQPPFKHPAAVTTAFRRSLILVRHQVAEISVSQGESVPTTMRRGRAPPIS